MVNKKVTFMRETLALCDHCYMHIPAITYEKDNEIFLEKECIDHGTMITKIETDPKFYFEYNYNQILSNSYLLDTTRKCNLKCTHCYQVTYNYDTEVPIQNFLNKVKSWPVGWNAVTFAGAEAFLRKDFFNLHAKIQQECTENQPIMILTNGVILSKDTFSKKVSKLENTYVTIGLHHKNYHSYQIRSKQLEGIKNCKKNNIKINSIVYTLNDFSELNDIIQEIQDLKDECSYFGINLSFDTGINPKNSRQYLSELIRNVSSLCQTYNYSFKISLSESDRSHCIVYINDIRVKLVQLPDVYNIDLGEANTQVLGDFFADKPPSEGIHQIILRDALVNKNIELKDTIPEKWRTNNDKRNWR